MMTGTPSLCGLSSCPLFTPLALWHVESERSCEIASRSSGPFDRLSLTPGERRQHRGGDWHDHGITLFQAAQDFAKLIPHDAYGNLARHEAATLQDRHHTPITITADGAVGDQERAILPRVDNIGITSHAGSDPGCIL